MTEPREADPAEPANDASPAAATARAGEFEDRRWLALWAKRSGDGTRVHPLLYHLVDVACVARELWDAVLSSGVRRRVAGGLGVDEAVAGCWVSWLAGLHDIGKASPAFQFQASDAGRPPAPHDVARARLAAAGFRPPRWAVRVPHGAISARVLAEILVRDPYGLSPDVARRAASVVGGHHGLFPTSLALRDLPEEGIGAGVWTEARRVMTDRLARVTGVLQADRPRRMDNATALFIAGLVSVADWIGSVEELFPYAAGNAGEDGLGWAAYPAIAADLARSALAFLHWAAGSPVAPHRSFVELFPRIPEPNGLQRACIELADALDAPGLVVIEAPMGEGKTEAAMYLAERWGGEAGRPACYFALPTQATSNQMFERVRDFLGRRGADGAAELQLLHGHAALSAEFAALRRGAARLLEPADSCGERPDVVASEWFTHRKRGLLAPFGVGTIDQILLAVLQTRHVFVRLFGLGQKTVVIDEVHAYDTYMTALLERLLEWLAALGAPVILLSATLPAARRRDLLAAYARGLGRGEAEVERVNSAYPGISWVTAGGAGSRGVRVSRRAERAVEVDWVDGEAPAEPDARFPLGERLAATLAGGGCAAVICNTVARAQEVYLALKPYFSGLGDDGLPELDLLHARFPYEEREDREKRALSCFGRPDRARRPGRAVLVATQIIEQSLDLDFDLMVSDLAPVDLLLQRSGRLWRHARPRPPGFSAPWLWIRRPSEADGLAEFGRDLEAIYDRHVLLRSWLALRDRASIRVPEDVTGLIEAVYDGRPCPAELPPDLQALWAETRREYQEAAESERREAAQRWLKPPAFGGELWRLTAEALAEDSPDLHRAFQALTRLAEPSVLAVCLYDAGRGLALDPEGAEPVDPDRAPSWEMIERLLRRSVPVSNRRAVRALLDREPPSGWRRSTLLRHARILCFGPDRQAELGGLLVRLDPELGLTLTRSQSEER